jgi:type I restriction enzyme M protein
MAKNELITIIDYISGITVNATPEGIDAVQTFSRQLVEDYGYPKEYIQTRPQYRVKVRPSGTKKEYPVDIAVFSDSIKNDDTLYIVVECKNKNRKDGRTHLENYLAHSSAYLGVWFNGEERFFFFFLSSQTVRLFLKNFRIFPILDNASKI